MGEYTAHLQVPSYPTSTAVAKCAKFLHKLYTAQIWCNILKNSSLSFIFIHDLLFSFATEDLFTNLPIQDHSFPSKHLTTTSIPTMNPHP